jgi:hypothetical protein
MDQRGEEDFVKDYKLADSVKTTGNPDVDLSQRCALSMYEVCCCKRKVNMAWWPAATDSNVSNTPGQAFLT